MGLSHNLLHMRTSSLVRRRGRGGDGLVGGGRVKVRGEGGDGLVGGGGVEVGGVTEEGGAES